MDTTTSPTSNTTQPPNKNELVPRLQLNDPTFIAYIVVMTVILAVGFVGNVLTIAVLRCREHRNKSISPLMINLAVADIIIIVFGYPVVVAANLSSGLQLIHSTCVWSGFINGAVGIASIANLAMMSIVMYSSFQSLNCTTKIPRTKMVAMIAFTWLYGIIAMFPPLVGWNEFVPGASGISCCPNWVPETKAGVAYNALLVFIGFVLPLSVIIFCYFRIYSFILTQQPLSQNASIRTTRRKHQIKLVRMIAMAIAAFVLSWSPYCFVSIIATIRGTNTLTPGEAEIPDLLAKASVIYNPIVYTAMNDKFRASLPRVIPCFRYCSRDYRSSVISRSNSRSHEYEANTAERKRHSQFKPHPHDEEIC